MQAIEGGAPTPVTPEGITGSLVTPDGTKVMGRDRDSQRKLFPLDPKNGPPEPLRFLEPADGVIRFTADGRGVLVRRPADTGGVHVIRVDLATGTRTPVRTISALPESVSQGGIGQLLMTADGTAYVYGYGVTHSDLFLVKGLK